MTILYPILSGAVLAGVIIYALESIPKELLRVLTVAVPFVGCSYLIGLLFLTLQS